jgi:thiosulfate dehydrogenase
MRYALLALVLAGCGPTPAKDVGASLFNDARFAQSEANPFSCSTCHADSDDDTRILPGANLKDAAFRSSYWGGYSPNLLDATNVCVTFFMRGAPLTRDDQRGRALYEYLASISPTKDAAPAPLTIVENVTTVARGNPSRGAAVYDAACKSCHGEPSTGAGRISELASIIPESSAEFAEQSGFPLDLVVVEKVRHGRFFGVGGTMPPFSTESLSDEDLGALLAFLLP